MDLDSEKEITISPQINQLYNEIVVLRLSNHDFFLNFVCEYHVRKRETRGQEGAAQVNVVGVCMLA